jgi:hypothetical protein
VEKGRQRQKANSVLEKREKLQLKGTRKSQTRMTSKGRTKQEKTEDIQKIGKSKQKQNEGKIMKTKSKE